MSNIILSPHIDDAVFSCWYSLYYQPTIIINVFSGLPPVNTNKLWDFLGGETNGYKMMNLRKQENDIALSKTNAIYKYLDFLDNQYRKVKISRDKLFFQILNEIPKDEKPLILVPLANGLLYKHPDHLLLQEVGIKLANRKFRVAFYPDVPYMYYPSHASDKYINKLVSKASRALNLELKPVVNQLTNDDIINRLKAAKSYKTQYKMTNLVSFNTLNANLKRNYCIYLEVI